MKQNIYISQFDLYLSQNEVDGRAIYSNYIYSKSSYNCHLFFNLERKSIADIFFLSQECVSSFSSIEKKDETQAFFEMIPKNNQVRFLCDFLIDFIISK